jgi:mannose-1-phosphate guanylyltransferase
VAGGLAQPLPTGSTGCAIDIGEEASVSGDVTMQDPAERVWAVVLASAESPDRTLRRAGQVIPPCRTVVMANAADPDRVGRLAREGMHVLVEPHDRGTAATILLPIHWIHIRDPKASVVVVGDLPTTWSEATVVGHVDLAARCAKRHAESLILTGLPRSGTSEHGFIVPGERIASAGTTPLFRVQRIVDLAPDASQHDALATVPILAGCTTAFISAGAEISPSLNERLARAVTFGGREHEHWALRQAYALAPRVDFFRSVLREIARSLAVIAVADVEPEDAGSWSPGSRLDLVPVTG